MIKKKLIFIIGILLVLPLINADIISINTGLDKNLVMNPNTYIEGFFSWVDVDVSIASWPIAEGGSILSRYFSNYTLEYDDNWKVDSSNIITIRTFDKNNDSLDVHRVDANFDQRFILKTDLERIDVGVYEVTFITRDMKGTTIISFDVDGIEQDAKINVYKDRFWLWILISLIFFLIIIITLSIVFLIRKRKKNI